MNSEYFLLFRYINDAQGSEISHFLPGGPAPCCLFSNLCAWAPGQHTHPGCRCQSKSGATKCKGVFKKMAKKHNFESCQLLVYDE